MGFGYRVSDYGTVNPTKLVRLLNSSGTSQCELVMNRVSNKLQFSRNNGTLIGSASSQAIALNVWYYIEIKVFINGSSGTAELRVNGVPWISGTSLNTGSSACQYVHLGTDSAANHDERWDDLYVCDGTAPNNDFLGDTRIQYLVPNGAGIRTQFTPNTTTNWQNLDESPAGDGDYNSASTPGAMDLFTMTDISTNSLVYAVQTVHRAKKDDAGHRKVEPLFYMSSGQGDTSRWYQGSKVPVVDQFAYVPSQIYNTSPDTDVAWTRDEINALQYGYAVGDAAMFTIDAELV
jgi:hypothetical protein